MYNSNNFILMISISKLKNIIDKNFDFIEIKKQNLIKIQLKENNTSFLKNYELEENDENESENTELNDENDELNDENDEYENYENENEYKNENDEYENDELNSSNFFLNSFMNVIDSCKFDIEDWQFIHNHKNKNDGN